MNKEDVIKMAREAGGGLSCIAEPLEHPWKFSESELMRFAVLVAAAERKALTKICAEFCYGSTKILVEKAIRARGQE